MYATWCLNRITAWEHSTHTPYFCLFGHPPDISKARVFGCDTWVPTVYPSIRDPENGFKTRVRIGDKAKRYLFMGIAHGADGWLLFEPSTREVIATTHATFCEDLSRRRFELLHSDLRLHAAEKDNIIVGDQSLSDLTVNWKAKCQRQLFQDVTAGPQDMTSFQSPAGLPYTSDFHDDTAVGENTSDPVDPSNLPNDQNSQTAVGDVVGDLSDQESLADSEAAPPDLPDSDVEMDKPLPPDEGNEITEELLSRNYEIDPKILSEMDLPQDHLDQNNY